MYVHVGRDIDNLDTDAFLTYLPTLANGIGGFFIVEQTLLQQVEGDVPAVFFKQRRRPEFMFFFFSSRFATCVRLFVRYECLGCTPSV